MGSKCHGAAGGGGFGCPFFLTMGGEKGVQERISAAFKEEGGGGGRSPGAGASLERGREGRKMRIATENTQQI